MQIAHAGVGTRETTGQRAGVADRAVMAGRSGVAASPADSGQVTDAAAVTAIAAMTTYATSNAGTAVATGPADAHERSPGRRRHHHHHRPPGSDEPCSATVSTGDTSLGAVPARAAVAEEQSTGTAGGVGFRLTPSELSGVSVICDVSDRNYCPADEQPQPTPRPAGAVAMRNFGALGKTACHRNYASQSARKRRAFGSRGRHCGGFGVPTDVRRGESCRYRAPRSKRACTAAVVRP